VGNGLFSETALRPAASGRSRASPEDGSLVAGGAEGRCRSRAGGSSPVSPTRSRPLRSHAFDDADRRPAEDATIPEARRLEEPRVALAPSKSLEDRSAEPLAQYLVCAVCPTLDGIDAGAELLRRLSNRQTFELDEFEGHPMVRREPGQLLFKPMDEVAMTDPLLEVAFRGRATSEAKLVFRAHEALAARFAEVVDEQPPRDRERPRHDVRVSPELAPRQVNLQEHPLQEVLDAGHVPRASKEVGAEPWGNQPVELGERAIVPRDVTDHGRIRPGSQATGGDLATAPACHASLVKAAT
jgi:hypothetical protein